MVRRTKSVRHATHDSAAPRTRLIEWVSVVLTAILAATAVGALVYASRQLNEAHEEAQIGHLLTLARQFDQEPMASYRRQLAEKQLTGKDADPKEFYRELDFFETIALLVQRDYLTVEDVWKEFSYWMLHLDADPKLRANLDEENKRDPIEYEGYVDLLKRVKAIDVAHHKTPPISADDLRQFYQEEKTIRGDSPQR
jgi:hypothetical protein